MKDSRRSPSVLAHLTGRRLPRTLAFLGAGLLLLPWLLFLGIRGYLELVGEEAGRGLAITAVSIYFAVAFPVGIGLLVASLFALLRERLSTGHDG